MQRLLKGVASLVFAVTGVMAVGLAMVEPDYSDWMATMPANTPLNRMLLPGTHDSDSYAISAQSKFTLCSDSPLPTWLQKLSDAMPFSIVRAVSAGWSKTQSLSLLQQLNQGARFLDMRVCDSSTLSGHKELYGCHSMLSARFEDLLQQVADFAKAHPLEVVIFDVGALYGDDSAADEDHFDAIFRRIIGQYAVPNQLTPASTLAEIRATGRNVIVLYDAQHRGSQLADQAFIKHYAWPQSSLHSPWPNLSQLNQLHAAFLAHVHDHSQSTSSGFDVNQDILTPNDDTVKAGLWPFGKQPHKLEDMAKSVDAQLSTWLNEAYQQTPVKPFNIVMVDWYSASLPLVDWAQRQRG